MNEADLLTFLRSQRWAVEATVSTALAPQAAIIGFAVTNQLELVFDTLTSSREVDLENLNPWLRAWVPWLGESGRFRPP